MDLKYIALFPGQGSQYVGMGKNAWENSDAAKEIFRRADESLGYSLSTLCFEGPEEELTATQNSQPAILTVSHVYYELFMDRYGITPLAAAGHSLGEYTALVAASALSFKDAVSIVHKRGRYMQEAVPRGEGTMVAVLGKPLEEVETALAQVSNGVAEVANINAPGQVIVAGDIGGIENFKALMEGAKIRELKVSAPFHCSLMEPARKAMEGDIHKAEFCRCSFPVFANVTADAEYEPEEIRRNLIEQITGRVRWHETVERLSGEYPNAVFIEFGPGRVLTGLNKKINRKLKAINISSFEDIALFESRIQ
ncbi:MAG: [acyl-carrier-protein] S-malonyltransferase [Candidatus Dadabacteria bacterium]|nr:MAG: [acyl-carrier-protein] S-malonyltransferase [Candidatus Dadabacteria bacterium]